MKNFTKEDALCLMNEAGFGIGGAFYVEDVLRFMSLVVERADLKPRLLDGQLRRLWAQYAATMHGWPNDGVPPLCDINGYVGFQESWHESEYQVFKAGYLSAFD